MKDKGKTNEQLVKELQELRLEVARLRTLTTDLDRRWAPPREELEKRLMEHVGSF